MNQDKFWRPWLDQTGGNSNNIVETSSSRSEKFKTTTQIYKIEFKPSNTLLGDANNEITELFADLHVRINEIVNESDMIRLYFTHRHFNWPMRIPFMSKNNFLKFNIRETFASIAQSYRSIELNKDNALTAVAIVAKLPTGSSCKKINEYFKKNTAQFIYVENQDNYCLIRSIILAKAYHDYIKCKDKKEKGKLLRKFNKLKKNNGTDELFYILDRTYDRLRSDKPLGIPECKIMEKYYDYKYQIIMLDENRDYSKPLYRGTPSKTGHYLVIINAGK